MQDSGCWKLQTTDPTSVSSPAHTPPTVRALTLKTVLQIQHVPQPVLISTACSQISLDLPTRDFHQRKHLLTRPRHSRLGQRRDRRQKNVPPNERTQHPIAFPVDTASRLLSCPYRPQMLPKLCLKR